MALLSKLLNSEKGIQSEAVWVGTRERGGGGAPANTKGEQPEGAARRGQCSGCQGKTVL